MARKAAELADERDSLMAQLRSSTRPPRAKKEPSSRPRDALDLAAELLAASGPSDKENEVPGWTPLTALGATKNVVRFSSPLLTPISNANAKLREADPHAAATWSTRNTMEAIQGNMAAYVCADPEADSEARVLSAFLGDADHPQIHWKTKFVVEERKRDEIALENSTLKALVNTKDLELAGLRKQIRVAEDRAALLLNELGLAKQVMGVHEGREVAESKAMLKDITFELAQAHNQQKELEADRDRSESSLLKQVFVQSNLPVT